MNTQVIIRLRNNKIRQFDKKLMMSLFRRIADECKVNTGIIEMPDVSTWGINRLIKKCLAFLSASSGAVWGPHSADYARLGCVIDEFAPNETMACSFARRRLYDLLKLRYDTIRGDSFDEVGLLEILSANGDADMVNWAISVGCIPKSQHEVHLRNSLQTIRYIRDNGCKW